MSICVDLTGMRFGKLIVVKKLKINPHREMEWLCLCDCGNEYVSTSNRLTTGKTTCCHSCAMKKISDTNKKHGCEPRKLWNMFQNMKTRCYNKKYFLYHRYGGRGITVCDEWKNDFIAFRKWAFDTGWDESLTLDRIDNDKGYCPENCKWSSVREQANNRSTNVYLEHNGQKDTLANWSRRLNIPYHVLQARLYKGLPDDQILSDGGK